MENIDLVKNCQSLDSLFKLWKKKQSEEVSYAVKNEKKTITINHKNNKFIPDGIVNPALWNDSNHKKILYVLKEAYAREDEKEYDLAEWLCKDHPEKNLWNRVARWTYGIQNTDAKVIARYVPRIDGKLRNECFEQIAVLNLKKSNGVSQSVTEEIAAYAKSDREEIIRELQLIDPDIVICGSTFKILYSAVFGNEPLKEDQKCDNWYYYRNLDGKERLYIDYYHPANQWDDLMNYYGITNIYQQALIEKANKEHRKHCENG